MPLRTVWEPDYAKLPGQLFGGAFTLVVNPPKEPPSKLYLFHDRTWFANCTHMLGWSREIIHLLSKPDGEGYYPDWLVGHAFRLQPDGSYKLSGSDKVFTKDELIKFADEAQKGFADADVTVGQWNDQSHDDWPEAIKREHDNVIRHHSEKFHRDTIGDDLKFHVLRHNESNAVHHPEYPTAPRQAQPPDLNGVRDRSN